MSKSTADIRVEISGSKATTITTRAEALASGVRGAKYHGDGTCGGTLCFARRAACTNWLYHPGRQSFPVASRPTRPQRVRRRA